MDEVKASDWKGECEEKDGKYVLTLNRIQGRWAALGWHTSIPGTINLTKFNSLYPKDIQEEVWKRKRYIDKNLIGIKNGDEKQIELTEQEIYCIYDGLRKWIRNVQETGIHYDFDEVDKSLIITKDFSEWLRHLKQGGYRATCFNEHRQPWEAECGPWYAMRKNAKVKCAECGVEYCMTTLCYMLK